MRVAVYVRVSTEDQNPQNQLLVCEKYCNENEYEIVDTYIDKKSGRSKKSRNNEKRRFASVCSRRDLNPSRSLERAS
jgi:DNA invertase Pin-like site-specific DNA recombinase